MVESPTTDDTNPDVHHAYYDRANADGLSLAVIQTIAAAADVDPTGTKIPMRANIDPDALDALFERSDERPCENARLAFQIWDVEVVVHNNGHIVAYNTAK